MVIGLHKMAAVLYRTVTGIYTIKREDPGAVENGDALTNHITRNSHFVKHSHDNHVYFD